MMGDDGGVEMIKKDDRSAELRRRTDRMVEHLGTLVRAETPSEDLAACADGAQVVSQLGKELLGSRPSSSSPAVAPTCAGGGPLARVAPPSP